jgi:hypothetical protein
MPPRRSTNPFDVSKKTFKAMRKQGRKTKGNPFRTKKPRTPRAPARAVSVPAAISSSFVQGKRPASIKTHVQNVCSLTNPFCEASIGRRIPDKYGGYTDTYSGRSTGVVHTGASGYAYVICAGGTGSATSLQIASATGTETIGNNPFNSGVGSWSGISANTRAARFCSGGVRFFNTLAATSAGGYVKIAKMTPDQLYGVTVTIGGFGDIAGNVETRDIRKEWSVIYTPTDELATALVAIPATGDQDHWSSYIMQFYGPANTDLGYVEFCNNYEYQLIANTGTPHVQRASTNPFDHAYNNAKDTVHATMPSVFDGAASAVERTVENLASAAWNKGTAVMEDMFGALFV